MAILEYSLGACLAAADELEALVLRAASMSPEQRQRDLLVALNNIELRILALPDVDEPPGVHEPSGGDDPGRASTHDRRHDQIFAAFPELGMYHHMRMYRGTPVPREDLENPIVGDGTGDLVQILSSIDDIRWVAKNECRANAVWWAKWHYDELFGEAMADLRAYLFRLRTFVP